MNNDLISREALLKEVRENKELYESERVYLEGLLLNAPTVEIDQSAIWWNGYDTGKVIGENKRSQGEYTEEDMKQAIKENFDIGYEMAKNKYGRPQSEWLEPYESKIAQECSICHRQMPAPKWFHFCPNCGADMRKGGAE